MLRPKVHHTSLKHKNIDSLYTVNNPYILSGNMPLIFLLGYTIPLLFFFTHGMHQATTQYFS